VAEALSYAHQRGVIHRDIKPGNILFDDESLPILTDFGIAKILETNESTLTGTGLGVGTPEYMAPEQWLGEASPATDQYALGVVLYELITGQKPYSADTPAAVAILQATEPLKAPSRLVTSIPDRVEKVLYKALAHNAADRYESMSVFQKALSGLVTGENKQPQAAPAVPIKTTVPAVKPEPEPVRESEEKTYDKLAQPPVEVFKQTANKAIEARRKAAKQPSTRVPAWVLWVGGAVLVISLLVGFVRWINSHLTITDGKEQDKNIVAVGEPAKTAVATEIPESTVAVTNIPTITLTQAPTNTLTQAPTLGIRSEQINVVDEAEMVYVPAGEFLMGSEEGDSDESPVHTVYLDAYWIYKYEVTNEQYRSCIEAGKCEGNLENYPKNNYPAVYIGWTDAKRYCAWTGGQLPTEAEWEKAALGTDGRTYPWGQVSPNCILANFSGCSNQALPVGSFPRGASPYGALDMAGNVWEWVADWYDEDYYQISPVDNPQGPESGEDRVLRGGSWNNLEWSLSGSSRYYEYIGYTGGSYGFRCVLSPKP